MADRLTQLQICLDQLLEQFCASMNYINTNPDFVPAEGEEKMADKDSIPIPEKEFQNTLNELSTDIILKTRQIFTIIESLPGVGVSTNDQLEKIKKLQLELFELKNEKKKVIKEKNEMLDWVNELIGGVSEDITETSKFSNK